MSGVSVKNNYTPDFGQRKNSMIKGSGGSLLRPVMNIFMIQKITNRRGQGPRYVRGTIFGGPLG